MKVRNAFVRQQLARLKKLQAAAACTVEEPPEEPAPPPLAPPLPGHYGGATSQGATVGIEVSADASGVDEFSISRIDLTCTPQGSTEIDQFDIHQLPYHLSPLGGTGIFRIPSNPMPTDQFAIWGRLTGSTGEGTFDIAKTFTDQGTNYKCTSGILTWTATHTG